MVIDVCYTLVASSPEGGRWRERNSLFSRVTGVLSKQTGQKRASEVRCLLVHQSDTTSLPGRIWTQYESSKPRAALTHELLLKVRVGTIVWQTDCSYAGSRSPMLLWLHGAPRFTRDDINFNSTSCIIALWVGRAHSRARSIVPSRTRAQPE